MLDELAAEREAARKKSAELEKQADTLAEGIKELSGEAPEWWRLTRALEFATPLWPGTATLRHLHILQLHRLG